ncbi:hypothetical protein FNV43_RR13982 [Rhamnella rubrinervis]|uniref:non-specific serine/threonine protein kinase n=1 Tax=Rhamnella rubrinervis TaxID=2594499 RepID=A0A8K0MFV8_9ROSA|nr:hypothetical protein FNV43_RR13982 [Rhamnella rubrinervis]
MHPYLSQNVFFFLMVTVLIFIHEPSSSSADEYSDCAADFECGNIRVGYPFWGSDRPEHCGHPKLELNCTTGDVTVITISSDTYRVLDVNENDHTLTAVRTDYWDNVCPQTETDLRNITLDTSIVNYTTQGYQSLTLFYTCTSQLALPSSNQFNCSSGSGSESTTNYFLAGELTLPRNAPYALLLTRSGTCQASVVLRISETQVETLESQASEENLKTAINDGFELEWDANNTLCDECQSDSSRRCGYSLTSGGFACFSNTQSQVDRQILP